MRTIFKSRQIVFIFFITIFSLSCSKDDAPKDCNCNRVTDATSFNLPLPPPNNIAYYYSTVNDCTGERKNGIPSNTKAINGECRK